MERDYKYSAFLSYSHKDEKWAAWLHKALETYRVPKHLVGKASLRGTIPAKLGKVFRDREELSSSASLGDDLTDALAESACQIVICSPHSANSHWTNEEILTYKRLGREDRIFCLIVDGEPHASTSEKFADQECFPAALRFRLDADGSLGRETAEPIAADARPRGDGRQNAKLKLIAGMLGVGFDDLKQRDAQRRHRRMLAITTAAVAGMVVAAGLAAFAVMQRNEAEIQRNRAEVEAVTARETSDFLISLFKVSDPSRAQGKTITAKEILDRGAARIEQDLSTQPATQARLMETIGSVYTSLGIYPSAAGMLQGALAKRRQLYEQNALEIGRTLDHLGEVLTLQAQYEEAEQAYRDALAIHVERFGHRHADVARIKAELADLLGRTGKYEQAEPLFRDALGMQEELLGARSAEYAKTLEGLALNLFDQGDYDTPIPMLREAVAILHDLHDPAPHPALAEALNNLGFVLGAVGRYAESEELYREALAMKRILYKEAHSEIAMGLNNVAFSLHDQGEFDEAEALYREALDIQRIRLGDDHPEVAMALSNLAYLLYDKGALDEAVSIAADSLAMYRQTVGDEHPAVARGMASLAMWLTESGDRVTAERLLRDSLELRQRLLGDDHTDVAASKTLLANVLIDTGRYEEAHELASAAHDIYVTALSDTHWRTAVAMSSEGSALAGIGRLAEAEALLVTSYEILKNDPGALAMFVTMTTERLADVYTRLERPEQAEFYLAMLRGGP